jgi:hypothetical protein
MCWLVWKREFSSGGFIIAQHQIGLYLGLRTVDWILKQGHSQNLQLSTFNTRRSRPCCTVFIVEGSTGVENIMQSRFSYGYHTVK